MDKETLKTELQQRLERLNEKLNKSETRLKTIDNNFVELDKLVAQLKDAVNEKSPVQDAV